MAFPQLPRIADNLLAWKLKTSGAVQTERSKWCGKTSTGDSVPSAVLMRDPDAEISLLALADSKPSA